MIHISTLIRGSHPLVDTMALICAGWLLCGGPRPLATAASPACKPEGESDSPSYLIPPKLENLGRDYKVRLIYFVPNDREVKKNYREKLEVLMRVVADIYRRDLQSKGYQSRGLDFEFEEDGRLKVYLIQGRQPAVFYSGKPASVDRLFRTQHAEISEALGDMKNRACLVFSEAGGIAEAMPIPHLYSGFAVVSGDVFRDEVTASTVEEQVRSFFAVAPVRKVDGTEAEPRSRAAQISNGVLIHELGHIFGMLHDTSEPNRDIMASGYHNLGKMFDPQTAGQFPVRFSPAHARMASASRFLSESFDASDHEPPTIEFKLVRQPKVGDTQVEFAIKATDNQGLKALVCMQRGGEWIDALIGGMDLDGDKSFDKTVRFSCPRPIGASQPVHYWINVVDVNGNLSQAIQKSDVAPK